MKNNIIWCICLLLISAVIPMAAGIRTTNASEQKSKSPLSVTDISNFELSDEDKEHIVSMVMEYADEESPKEAQKAILAICKNNYLYYKMNDLSPDTIDISSYSDEFYLKLCTMYEENDTQISYNNETVYIPLTELCSEHTATSDEYPYMSAVASPWDVFSPDYNSDREYSCGISLYGVEYLCDKGSSATEVLRWYLPNFEIEDDTAE